MHINRLKAAHGHDARESKPRAPNKSRQRTNSAISHNGDELIEVQLGARPILKEVPQDHHTVHNPPLCSPDSSSLTHHTFVAPTSERYDPSYLPENTPRSRREIFPYERSLLLHVLEEDKMSRNSYVQCRYTYSW